MIEGPQKNPLEFPEINACVPYWIKSLSYQSKFTTLDVIISIHSLLNGPKRINFSDLSIAMLLFLNATLSYTVFLPKWGKLPIDADTIRAHDYKSKFILVVSRLQIDSMM